MPILKFKHKGLEKFFLKGTVAGIQAKHKARLRLILGRLNTAREPRDMDLPGLALHPLKGNKKNFWAVKVSGSWRITFRFEAGDVDQVGYEDYH
ncbi:MAG: peptidase [Candidatus Eisenbacteria bacterium]|uniref:Peptidase n=1 Tax=Eiseniibacteriota bacterium TaxID=2212470 RepID=A0A7Y2E5A4_UNCEI|nr:peptidase [Candidatus Eisenbacteria bacterium]